MKKIYIFLLALLYIVQVNAQFSIRRNTASTGQVDILYKPLASGSHSVQYFEFSVQIPYNVSAPATASFAPGAALASISSFTPASAVDGSYFTFAWSAAGLPNYASTYVYTASLEVILGTITFSPGTNVQNVIVNAIDYQNAGRYGGNTDAAVWTMQQDASSTDITNYGSLFYQSAASGGTAGSDAPTSSSGNQQLFLTNTPLPVTLVSFVGNAVNCTSVLKWVSAAEYNSNYYAIEHSSDGITYTEIARVNSNNSATGAAYTYIDKNVTIGANYYRLKPTDFDGHFKYSDIITITTECTFVPIKVSPNPAVDIVTVTGLNGKNTLTVIDATGKQVAVIITSATNQKINMSRFSRGHYTISVTGANGTVTNLKMAKL